MTNELEAQAGRGFKLTYRLTGRATQAEERILKSTKYLMDEEEVTPKAKYKELKVLFDEHGWPGLDKEQTKLFDELNNVFGNYDFDSKAESAAAQLKSLWAKLNRSYLDKPGHSDRTESAHYLLLARGRLGACVTVLGDGVTLRKARVDAAKTPISDEVGLHARYKKKLIWCDVAPETAKPDSSCFISGGLWYRARTHTDYRKELIYAESSLLADPENVRAVLECYRVEYPEKDYPEHTLWPRKPRSPTRKDVGYFWEYHESFEPLQSNFLKADHNKYTEGWEPGDPIVKERNAEAELETRPSVEWWKRFAANPNVQYDARGFPLSGDVECLVEYLETETTMRGKKSVEIKRWKLVNISNVDMSKNGRFRWRVYRIGDARFGSPGVLSHYRENGGWHPVKDEYGTPYGPKDIAKGMGSDEKYWVSLIPLRTTKMVKLTPEKHARQLANRPKPIPCPMTADEALKAFRPKLEANGKTASANAYDRLPSYDVPWEIGRYTHAKIYADNDDEPPCDDVVEFKDYFAKHNARLSPQTRLVNNAVGQNQTDIGAALHTGSRNPSVSALKRLGKRAMDNAKAENIKVFQGLAA